MDRFTILASKMLQEYGNVMSTSDEEKNFKPHMMYDPETGEAFKADTYDDHLKFKEMGYVHEKPEEDESIITPDDQKALDVATKLSTGVKGKNILDNPQKKIDKALGSMYNKLAARIEKLAAQVDKGA